MWGFTVSPFSTAFFRQQAGRQQHPGIGGVGAGGDGGDQHVAIAHLDAVTGGKGLAEAVGRLVETVLRHGLGEQRAEAGLHLPDLDPVLGALWAGQRWRHGGQVEHQGLGVVDIARLRHAEQALGLEIGLEGVDFRAAAASAFEVGDGFLVHREEAHGGAVFRCHVGDGGAVGQGQGGGALAEELHELAHHLFLAQQLGDGEDQIGGGDAFTQPALQLHTHHIGGEEIHRLAQHAGLRLDAAHTPAHHADAVDHGGVAVGAHEGVRIVDAALVVHAAGQVFQVHLVDDAKAGRHDAEGIEGLHAPLHELVALAVALELELHVEIEGVPGAVVVDHHRVIHHQVHRHQRLDGLGVLAQLAGDVAHGSQIGQQRHAGEVLQHHAGHQEGNLRGALRAGLPGGELAHVGFGDLLAIAVAQHRLEHDANGHRQARDGAQAGLLQGRQGVVAAFPGTNGEALQRIEQVVAHRKLRGAAGETGWVR